ncbi:hypothetical protein FRC07_008302 [Ceratobasidium sp. 392]|nr:hypothetical protein FRC07_008302 [Ceratobasidium sp. 392]
MNEVALDEKLDALDPLRHLRDDTNHEVVPPQIPTVVNQIVELKFPPLETPVKLVVDAGPGCGGVAWPAGEVNAWVGTGLVGLVASLLGAQEVVITDQEQLMKIMESNVELNELKGRVRAVVLNWGEALPSDLPNTASLVLAADCVYAEPAFPLLVSTLRDLDDKYGGPEILFCYKKRRKADKRFFGLLKKHFTWAEHDLPSSILVRSESIIFCTRTIRAIIKADKLIMLESLGGDEPPTKESEGRSPILNSVMAHIRALTLRAHHTDQQDAQTPFEFTVKDAVAEILSEPDDMRKMYLTDLKAGKVREFGDDDEVELLLETYLKYAASLTLNASRNLQRLNSASQHLTLLLSSTRNRLLHLEIRLAIAMLAVSAAALPGAILGAPGVTPETPSLRIWTVPGMNLTNHFEGHPWAFYVVTSIIAIIAMVATQAGRAGLRVARRVKMEQAGLLAGGKLAVRAPSNPPRS